MRFIAAAIVCVLPLLAASPAELEHARKLYRYTDYSGSLQVLAAIQPKDGPVYALTGQNLYMQGEYKKATESLEKALAAEPNNSDYALWLGRAYGRRAETRARSRRRRTRPRRGRTLKNPCASTRAIWRR